MNDMSIASNIRDSSIWKCQICGRLRRCMYDFETTDLHIDMVGCDTCGDAAGEHCPTDEFIYNKPEFSAG